MKLYTSLTECRVVKNGSAQGDHRRALTELLYYVFIDVSLRGLLAFSIFTLVISKVSPNLLPSANLNTTSKYNLLSPQV